METRTLDPTLDKLTAKQRKLQVALRLHDLISRTHASGRHVLVEMLSRWKTAVGLTGRVGDYLRRSPHVFEVYKHPTNKAPCCRVGKKMKSLIVKEARARAVRNCTAGVEKVRRIIMMSTAGRVHVYTIWLVRNELGLPDNFRVLILTARPETFKVSGDGEFVELSVAADAATAVTAEVEKWRRREHREKWLCEHETKYAFPIQFPTGFRKPPGFNGRLRVWQRLQYVKPYETGPDGGARRYEKRAVGLIHELLCLTVEKSMPVERLTHFRKEMGMMVNVRELLLKHPGVFYVSTRGGGQTVFLREAYSKGCLVESNEIYDVRREMRELVALGRRNTRRSMLAIREEQVAPGSKDGGLIVHHNDDWLTHILLKSQKQ